MWGKMESVFSKCSQKLKSLEITIKIWHISSCWLVVWMFRVILILVHIVRWKSSQAEKEKRKGSSNMENHKSSSDLPCVHALLRMKPQIIDTTYHKYMKCFLGSCSKTEFWCISWFSICFREVTHEKWMWSHNISRVITPNIFSGQCWAINIQSVYWEALLSLIAERERERELKSSSNHILLS